MQAQTVVLVTGSRKWVDAHAVGVELAACAPRLVIHGDARGLDALAGAWARDNSVEPLAVPAPWDLFNNESQRRSAGMWRNQRMVDIAVALRALGHDVVCLAFPLPGSVGTWDCVRRLRRAGFVPRVVEVG